MYREPFTLIKRRFFSRILESGMLIIAVALGVGVSAAGFALLTHTMAYSNEILQSPAFREITASTRNSKDDMDTPVLEKSVSDTTVLTSADLDAAELIPSVVYSYVSNQSRLHFLNQTSFDQQEKMQDLFGPPSEASGQEKAAAPERTTANEQAPEQPAPGTGQTAPMQPAPGTGQDRFSISQLDLDSAAAQEDIVIVELDEISGYEVTPGFFDAWGLQASAGSLFSSSDMTGTSSLVVLGSGIAETIAGTSEDPYGLIGKKLLAREGLYTVVGVLEGSDETYSDLYFTPYQDRAAGSTGQFRRRAMDTQLIFSVDDPQNLKTTSVMLSDWFSAEFGEDQVIITNQREAAQRTIARNTGISVLILVLSLSGLLIACVNISNILMSRALRMKKYTGILMALGSSQRGILKLYALEALAVSLLGSVIGSVLAIPLSRSMQSSLDIGGNSVLYIMAGIVIAGIITFVFSVAPGYQNSRVIPAEAMRGI